MYLHLLCAEILPEVMKALKDIGAEHKMEVWVDGGIRRGTDIFKALALGRVHT